MEVGNSWLGAAQDGSQYTELNSDSPGAICQTISTVQGMTYRFSFYFSARPNTPLASNEMNVSWDGHPLALTIAAAGQSDTSWSKYTYTVTATSTSTTIEFADVGQATYNGCDCGSLLDNVQLNPIGSYTNTGTNLVPLQVSGTVQPGTVQNLYETSDCSGTPIGSARADASGNWTISLVNVSEGVHTYRVGTPVVEGPDFCSVPITLTVDHSTPTSTITFPGVLSSSNASTWSAGCSPVGICGSASDSGGSNVAAVYLTVRGTSGANNGLYWDGSTFTSTATWVRASGTTSWNVPLSLLPNAGTDGTYTIVSAAVDTAGNAEPVLLQTTTPCQASGGGVTYSAGGGTTYSAGGGSTYSAGGGGACSGSGGGATYSAGGGVTYSAGGGSTYSAGGGGGGSGAGCSSSATGGGATYSAGGGVTYSAGGGATYSAGGSGSCNILSAIIDTTPPAISFVQAGSQTIGDGFVNVNPASTIHVVFSEGMTATVTPATATGPSTAVINGTVSLTPSVGTSGAATCGTDLTCENVSLTNLAPSTSYTLTVSGVTDWAGNPLPDTIYHFVTAANGTLNTADSDHDGIPDTWETAPSSGGAGTPITVTSGGTSQRVYLSTWGFTPGTQDLCVVENYMSGAASDGRTYNQAISQAANQAIVNAFAAKSIHLVIFEGDAAHSAGLPTGYSGPYYGGPIPMVDPLGSTATGAFGWSSTFAPTTAHPNATSPQQSYDQIRTQYFASTGLSQVCHYAVIAHQIGDSYSSGSARGFGSSDFVIALGTTSSGVGTQPEQQGTVMHELGHNLGLRHGGGDEINNKPDYPSVMNYSFQFGGVIGGSAVYGLDYSSGTLLSQPLDESALSDSTGLGSTTLGTRYFCSSSSTAITVLNASSSSGINWGCNASGLVTGSHSADINGDGAIEGSATGTPPLSDFNDWGHLNFLGGVIGLGAVAPPATTSTIDVSDAESGGVDSASAVESKSGLYKWTGFFAPLASDYMGNVINTGKGGRTYPVKFQLQNASGAYITSLNAVSSITVGSLSSCTGGQTDPIDYSVTSATSGLRYDSTANQFVYNWTTPTSGCYMLKVSLADGTTKLAKFQLS